MRGESRPPTHFQSFTKPALHRMELQGAHRARGLYLKTGLLQGCPSLCFSSSSSPSLPWCLTRDRGGAPDRGQGTRQGSEGLIGHPMGVVCEQKSHRKDVALDHQDGEQSGDWVSVLQIHWSRCCLVAGGQDEASGEILAPAHLPVTKAALCL